MGEGFLTQAEIEALLLSLKVSAAAVLAALPFALVGGDDGCESGEREVDPRVGHLKLALRREAGSKYQVGLELGQVHVQRPV